MTSLPSNEKLLDMANKLKLAGLKSLKLIAICGPSYISDTLNISLTDSEAICSAACTKLEASGQISRTFEDGAHSLQKRSEVLKISTGSHQLDTLLDGGVEAGAVTEIFGGPGTGKTQLCLTLCASLANCPPKLQNKGIFIDTEGKFRPERISQIASVRHIYNNILSNILTATIINSPHLISTLIQAFWRIESNCSFKLLIVDSLMGLLRLEFPGRHNLMGRQIRLSRLLRLLLKASQVYNIAIVITNQVMSTMTSNEERAAGGSVIAHATTYRLKFRKLGYTHYAEIINSPFHPPSLGRFTIGPEGVTDLQ
jgi:DNA repair protein RadA